MSARPPRPLRVGLDYRPALVNREGIGRATRELVRALLERAAEEPGSLELELFGWTLAAPRATPEELGLAPHLAAGRARLARLRVPARLQRPLLGLRGGVDAHLAGGRPLDLFHHTQPARLPVGATPQSTMLWDCIWLADAQTGTGEAAPGWVEHATARRMAASARAALAASALVLTPTDHVRADILARLAPQLRPPGARLVTTGLGCDHLPPPDTTALVTRPPFLLTVGRVDPRKDHATVLAAFEALVRQGLPHHLVVAGPRGWRAEAFAAAVSASPARERVHWLGSPGASASAALFTTAPDRPPTDAELAGLYAGCDAFVFASRAEGFGLPPLEALRAGRPVVAARATCLPEVLGDAVHWFAPGSPEALAAALNEVLCRPGLARELAARGPAQAARHTWRGAAERTLAAWRETVGGAPTGPTTV